MSEISLISDDAPQVPAAEREFSHSVMHDVKDALLIAADVQEEHGFAKGYLLSEDGRCCTSGALAIALGYTVDDMKGRRPITKDGNYHNETFYDELDRNPVFIVVGRHLGFTDSPSREIGVWNDEYPFNDTKLAAATLRDIAAEL